MSQSEWKETTRLIDLANEILAREYPATLRQTFYCLIAVNAIANSDADYKKVSRLLTKARLDGRISYEWIVDRSRPTYRPNVFDDPEEYAKVIATGYHRDYWLSQPEHCEIWSEKDAIIGSIEPVTDKYGVIVRVARGFNSTTRVREIAEELFQQEKPKHILYIGDFDPSGQSIEVDYFRRVLRHMCDLSGWRGYVQSLEQNQTPKYLAFIAGVLDIKLRRLAIHPEDIEKFNLPPQQVKDTDSRALGFIEEFGKDTVELNALPPTELRRRISRAIRDLLDREAWSRAMAVEKVEQESIVDFAKTFGKLAGHDEARQLEKF